jgi:16S rRNA (uracil1498-N3)-methyltransferase
MPRFFCTEPIQPSATFSLDARIAQHVRVLRLREGDAISLFDGCGGELPATLTTLSKRDVLVTTSAHVAIERETQHRVTLYPSLIANDRFDWLIQKATELGVAAIQPIFTERSQRIPGDVEKRTEHWLGVAIAACEQCGRNQIPNICPPITLSDALAVLAVVGDQSLILLDADGSMAASPVKATSSSAVFIGPEGGFSATELALLRKRCDHKLRLGPTVLRAETAAIASLVWLGSLQ